MSHHLGSIFTGTDRNGPNYRSGPDSAGHAWLQEQDLFLLLILEFFSAIMLDEHNMWKCSIGPCHTNDNELRKVEMTNGRDNVPYVTCEKQ